MDEKLKGFAEENQKLQAVKLVREVKGLPLKDARDYVEKRYGFERTISLGYVDMNTQGEF